MVELARRFGITEKRKSSVSTGVSPPVLLGLAPLLVTEIFRIIRELNEHEGLTVLVVEQNAHIALQLASTAYVLEVGRVALSGPSSELQEHESVRRSYLGY